jgi:hypothetical protein
MLLSAVLQSIHEWAHVQLLGEAPQVVVEQVLLYLGSAAKAAPVDQFRLQSALNSVEQQQVR